MFHTFFCRLIFKLWFEGPISSFAIAISVSVVLDDTNLQQKRLWIKAL